MTACVLHFAVPPERLGHEPSYYMQKDIGPTWPQEAHNVVLNDLKSELQSEKPKPVMKQLESRGFAVLRNHSKALGTLQDQKAWNASYLEETAATIKKQLGADEVFCWNSVTRSTDPAVNTPYGSDHFQDKAIKGLQFSEIRPTASGAHVDQDGPNSMRMCKGATGEDVFERFSRVQQLNVWRPLKGPVTCKPLAVCDGLTVMEKSKAYHMGMFGTRIMVHHDGELLSWSLVVTVANVGIADVQKWYYIKQQEADEIFILKIFDSKLLDGEAPYTPHTGVDELFGADGPETPRESIEVRVVVCYK